ncbi:MAG TPA: NAD(+)/NADH kinase [Candidatus Limicola stercorigallinarum]|nr:NAD(+)/NADH kinase [Candidatus Limicola stercorigallinarum]
MRCLIIHNLASGPHSDEIFTFAHMLSAAGDEIVMRFIGDGMEPEEATADVRTFDRVVVSGGDGTVSSVLDKLRGTGVPALIFPSGTANLFFNNIGNAPEAAALAKACRAGRTAKVDMGELYWKDEAGNIQRHGFLIIAGSGFDATIMEKAGTTKNEIGEVAYALAGLSTLAPQVAHFTIEHDGVVDELDGISCMLGNTAVIQNDINLFPGCRMDDGMLDIVVIEASTLVQLLPTAIAGVFDPAGKGLGRPQFKMFQAREAKITCTPSLGMQFDGELISNNSGVFGARVLPSCLDIIIDEFSNLA